MPLDPKRVQAVFLAVTETTDPDARAALLDRECAGDTELRQRIEALLRADGSRDSVLDAVPNFEADTPDEESTQALDSSTGSPIIAPATETTGNHSPHGDLNFLAPSSKPGSIGRLGHYEILKVIGQGGFGTVFKAFDEKLHRMVAIKALSPAFAAHGAARKRFIREARTAAAIKNEHVVSIYDVDEDAQTPYLAMEIIDGISLQDKLDKHGPLGLKEILRIGSQMAGGLAAAHKQGLVHRDIKPANILLENGVERVKITDFGLARSVDDASVTQSGTVAGTPMYMSPEQAEGVTIDHRSDLFSLGTVLYAMCTGHPPFRASGTHAVLKRVIDASPRPIREINSEIPEWLCDIISKLHAKRPEDRFQKAKEVAELLEEHLAHLQQPATAPRPAPVLVPAPAAKVPIPAVAYRLSAVVATALCFVAGIFGILALLGSIANFRDSTLLYLGAGLFAISSVTVAWQYRRMRATRPWTPINYPLAVSLATTAAGCAVLGYFWPAPANAVGYVHITPANEPVDFSIQDKSNNTVFDTRWVLPRTDDAPAQDGFALDLDRRFHKVAKNHGYTTFVLPVGEYTLLAIKESKWYHREKLTVGNTPSSIRIPSPPEETGWAQLFNGKDLTGWREFGATRSSGGEIVLFPDTAVDTIKSLPAHFQLRMQVKLTTGTGVIRFGAEPRQAQANPPYPKDGWYIELRQVGDRVSVEVSARSPANENGPGSTATHGTGAKIGEWFTLEITAKDKKTELRINDDAVPAVFGDLKPGVLSLWNNGVRDSKIAFRNIRVKELPGATLHRQGPRRLDDSPE
ncbi:MAG TPA: protein kinase [Gemmataceae bacterium]|nr:protein kinase [Gemmataceae bacterium]